MKPTLKTTAVAILVALGVSACGSSGGGSTSENTPSVINPTTPDDNAGNTTNDNAGNTTNDNTGNTTNDNTGNTTNDNTGKNDNPVDPITPPTPSDKPEVLGGTWRYVNLEFLQDKDYLVNALESTGQYSTPFSGSGRIDLNALANGKSGTIEAVATGEDFFANGKQQTDGVKVIFENKPYSTYGFVTVKDENNQDSHAYFGYINYDKEGESAGLARDNVYRKIQERGNAVYEGNVYAMVNRRSSLEEGFKDNWSQPILDGKVKMSVYVDQNSAKTVRNRGEITSNELNGTITLAPSTISPVTGNLSSFGNAIFNGKQGKYNTMYSANEAKEMIGDVNLTLEENIDKYDGKKITEYRAVFGGTADK